MVKALTNNKIESIKTQEQIVFNVSRIRELTFTLNENLFKPNEKDVIVNYACRLGHNDKNFVDFRLHVSFVYKNFENEELFKIDVQNIFEVKELKRFIDKDNKLLLPGWFLITLVSMSVGHTRAILAIHTAGSIFSNRLIPIVNSTEMTTAFFGEEAINRE